MIARLSYQAQENGLPAGNELNRVARMEDAIGAALQRSGAVHVGHLTGGGQMVAAWYAPSVVSNVVTVKTGLLSKKEIVLETRPDEEWLWFDNELALTPIEYELNRNFQLLKKLAEMGDNPGKRRPVDFTFFFDRDEQRQEALNELSTEGFYLNDEGCWTTEGEHKSFGVSVALETSIEEEVIAKICVQLREIAERHDGEFDGWATPVAR